MPRRPSDPPGSVFDAELDEPFAPHDHKGSSLWASVRAGLNDLRTFPLLVSVTAASVFVATILVLASPILTQVTEVGQVHVTRHSEIIVLLEADLDSTETQRVATDIAAIEGARTVRLSEPDDLELLPPDLFFRFESGPTLVIEPSGFVDTRAIEFSARQTPGVVDVALALGVLSQLSMDLVRMLVPWLAAVFVAAGLLLVANLAMLAGSSRREEADVMRLVGAGTWTIWLRTGLVIALPTVLVILVTTALVASAVPTVAGILLPAEAAAVVAVGPVLRTGLLLAAAAAFIATSFSLLAVWQAARR